MALKGKNAVESLPIELLDVRDELKGTQPTEDLISIPLCLEDKEKVALIGSSLSSSIQHQLTEFLQDNADVFAWVPADMPDIDPEISTHRLGVDSTCRPVKQKRRHFAFERRQAIKEEVERLLKADFIREIRYSDWLANVVLVKKTNGKWRTCIDFTDLNKACPKDSYPLPKIDQLIDATAGHELVSSGKVLGFMVSQRGIEANPEKIRAVMELTAPKTIREVQRLTGMIAALGRFISKSAERCLPFFSAYAPRPAIKAQVLADFVAECTIPQQFIDSEAVQPPVAEEAAPKECITKGAEIEIVHLPAKQDFTTSSLIWEVHVDASSNKSGCGAGLVLTGPDDFTTDYALRFGFRTSNNEAEYEALLAGMSITIQTGAQNLKSYCDSQLVANQIQGVYEARDERMIKYLAKVCRLASKFKSFEVIRIPRTENAKADVLSKLAASGYTTLGSICMEFLQRSSIESEAAEIMQVGNEPCWMDEIISYLRDGKLPEDKKEARKRFTSVAQPQTNGQTEVTNRILLQGIKKRLDEKAGRWADELYHVLWAYRTTPRMPIGESPFNLSFGTEAVIPVDIGTPSPRVTSFDEQLNTDGLLANLDLLEEIMEESRIRVAAYKQKVSNYHDSKIRPRELRTGDLVLRRAAVSQPTKVGKLSPTWEGPYRVKEVIRPGSYKLETLEEHLLLHAWNSKNLRKYYQ
ncbi:uncharacterized protein LOC143855727 [Tasmannia lanceolata]|uniref:uncharacterized protein LOC143855727 n=1 Tax=Tasmannia lanceolata TaxID=3420 RepID=UPI004063AFC5